MIVTEIRWGAVTALCTSRLPVQTSVVVFYLFRCLGTISWRISELGALLNEP